MHDVCMCTNLVAPELSAATCRKVVHAACDAVVVAGTPSTNMPHATAERAHLPPERCIGQLLLLPPLLFWRLQVLENLGSLQQQWLLHTVPGEGRGVAVCSLKEGGPPGLL